MDWKKIEEYSRCLAKLLPSITDVEKLKKHLKVSIPSKLDTRFQNGPPDEIPFLNLYLEILITWSVINESSHTNFSMRSLLAEYGVQLEEPAKTVSTGSWKSIVNKAGMSSIKFSIDEEIGFGHTARVYKGLFARGDVQRLKPAAIKKMQHDSLKSNFSQELEIHSTINNEFLVKLFDVFLEEDFVYIAMELAEYDIETWLKRNDPTSMSGNDQQIYRSQVLQFLRNICLGLQALHQEGIIHRDLKPQNILICKGVEGLLIAKLSDFGTSRLDAEKGIITCHPELGTSRWKPPEVLIDKGESVNISKSYDMFSLGLNIFYIASNRKHLFSYKDELITNDIEENIKRGNINWNQNINAPFKICEIRYLIEGLVDSSPDFRSNISKVLRHPLFWNDDEKINFLCQLNSDFTSNRGNSEYDNFIKHINTEFNKMPEWMRGWKFRLCQIVQNFLSSEEKIRRGYNPMKCTSLVTFIADKKRHYESFKKHPDLYQSSVFGQNKENYNRYFLDRFVELVPKLYEFVQKTTVQLAASNFNSQG